MIVATSQQSRFHTETLDGGNRKDIDLKQVNVSVGDTELLVDCHLKLFAGVRYGLIGRNGVGKSTLLKALGGSLLIGLPTHIRILYVDQLEGIDTQQSVLQVVLACDTRSAVLTQRCESIEEAMGSGDADQLAMAMRQLHLDNLQDKLTAATKIATHRSGLRGLHARAVQVDLTAQVDAAFSDMQTPVSAEEASRAQGAAVDVLDHMYEEMDALDVETAPARAQATLAGLGFTPTQQNAPIEQLSGGWRMRVAIAQALVMKPDVLLLDEPTNHLDIQATLWLASYLQQLHDVTQIIVSHDRAFLNAVTTHTIVLQHKSLTYYTGNYDQYVITRVEKRLAAGKQVAVLEKKREAVEKSIAQGVRHARRTGDDNALGMVASRKKKLERLTGVETNVRGHRFQVSKDMIGYFHTMRREVQLDVEEAGVVFKLPQPSALRSRGSLLAVEDVSFSYPNAPTAVLHHVTLNLEMGERIALIGANGQGKSTLVKLIMGTLTPTQGSITRHREALVGVFMQNDVDTMLAAAEQHTRNQHTKDQQPSPTRPTHTAGGSGSGGSGGQSATPTHQSAPPPQPLTVLSWLQQQHPHLREDDIRGRLNNQYGIKQGVATQPLLSLSGGQAVRVALCNVLIKAPQLLVLDEVTNHLDMDSVQGLAEALRGFTGGLVLVSHDQWFVQQVAQRVYVVQDARVQLLEGGVEEYVQRLQGQGKKQGKGSALSLRQQAREKKKKAAAGDGEGTGV